jgi:hypothetical protein
MDIGTFIVRIVEALAWPTVAGVAFWSVRGQIGALVGRIQRLKWKDAEATFSEELDKVEDKAPTPPAPDQPAEVEERVAFAQLPPAYIVQQAWLRLEQAVQEAAVKQGVQALPVRGVSRGLLQRLGLSPEDQALIEDLRQLRNRAVHFVEPDITVTDALRYAGLAETLARRIDGNRPTP